MSEVLVPQLLNLLNSIHILSDKLINMLSCFLDDGGLFPGVEKSNTNKGTQQQTDLLDVNEKCKRLAVLLAETETMRSLDRQHFQATIKSQYTEFEKTKHQLATEHATKIADLRNSYAATLEVYSSRHALLEENINSLESTVTALREQLVAVRAQTKNNYEPDVESLPSIAPQSHSTANNQTCQECHRKIELIQHELQKTREKAELEQNKRLEVEEDLRSCQDRLARVYRQEQILQEKLDAILMAKNQLIEKAIAVQKENATLQVQLRSSSPLHHSEILLNSSPRIPSSIRDEKV